MDIFEIKSVLLCMHGAGSFQNFWIPPFCDTYPYTVHDDTYFQYDIGGIFKTIEFWEHFLQFSPLSLVILLVNYNFQWMPEKIRQKWTYQQRRLSEDIVRVIGGFL
jgi:hypothetical protein